MLNRWSDIETKGGATDNRLIEGKAMRTVALSDSQDDNEGALRLRGGGTMRCDKCGGIMEAMIFNAKSGESFSGHRCVLCGDIVDQVILEHRNGADQKNQQGRGREGIMIDEVSQT